MKSNQSGSSETLVAEQETTGSGVAVSRTIQTLFALGFLTYAGAMLGFGVQPLPKVNPVGAVDSGTGGLVASLNPSATWLRLTVVTVIGLALCTPFDDERRLRHRLGVLVGAGYWVAVTAVFALLMSDMRSGGFTPGDRGCVYDGCWPAGVQQGLLAAPALPTALAMILMGTVFATRHWVVRMLVPPAIFVAAAITQALTREAWVVPLLESAP